MLSLHFVVAQSDGLVCLLNGKHLLEFLVILLSHVQLVNLLLVLAVEEEVALLVSELALVIGLLVLVLQGRVALLYGCNLVVKLDEQGTEFVSCFLVQLEALQYMAELCLLF